MGRSIVGSMIAAKKRRLYVGKIKNYAVSVKNHTNMLFRIELEDTDSEMIIHIYEGEVKKKVVKKRVRKKVVKKGGKKK